MLATCGTDHRVRGLAGGSFRLCSLVALRNLLDGGALDLGPGAAMHRHMLTALGQTQPGIAGAGMGMGMAGAYALTGDRMRP